MKKINCYDCEVEFKSETREDILNQLYDHYIKNHNEIITSADEVAKKKWMERFTKDWDSAQDA